MSFNITMHEYKTNILSPKINDDILKRFPQAKYDILYIAYYIHNDLNIPIFIPFRTNREYYYIDGWAYIIHYKTNKHLLQTYYILSENPKYHKEIKLNLFMEQLFDTYFFAIIFNNSIYYKDDFQPPYHLQQAFTDNLLYKVYYNNSGIKGHQSYMVYKRYMDIVDFKYKHLMPLPYTVYDAIGEHLHMSANEIDNLTNQDVDLILAYINAKISYQNKLLERSK